MSMNSSVETLSSNYNSRLIKNRCYQVSLSSGKPITGIALSAAGFKLPFNFFYELVLKESGQLLSFDFYLLSFCLSPFARASADTLSRLKRDFVENIGVEPMTS